MEPIKIEFNNWTYTCSDGCCTDYGMEIYINGELVKDYREDGFDGYVGLDSEVAVLSVLKHLNIKYEIK